MATIIVPSQGGYGDQAPILRPLTLSSSSVAAGANSSAQILGLTPGSTVTATSSDGTVLTVTGATLTGVFASPGQPTITLVESLPGAVGGSLTSSVRITVAVVLRTLALSTTSFSAGVAVGTVLATISNKTPGSQIAISPADISGRFAVSADGKSLLAGIYYSEAAASTSVTLQEQFPGAATTSTSIGVTISGGSLAISGTPGSATVGAAYSFTPSIVGGTPPYTVALTGSLPGGLGFSTSTGAITGTPTTAGTTNGLNMTVTDATGATASLGVFSLIVSTGSAPGNAITFHGSPLTVSGSYLTF